MSVLVNGAPRTVEKGTTIADLIAELGHDPAGRGVAAAHNGDVVPRAAWSSTTIDDGDRVEVLAAIGGG